jgi:pilus assembly protein FimV
MVYLDLLKIYHAMGMRDDYRLLTDRFRRLFKACVPDYAGFRNEGLDLSTYEEAIAQISLHWSSPQVVDVINAFIYTDSVAEPECLVDLQAFRDLLLLRAVAQSKLEAPQAEGRSARQKMSVVWQG